jgi:hypothetical protein
VSGLSPAIGEMGDGGMQSTFNCTKWNIQHVRDVLIAEALKVRHE